MKIVFSTLFCLMLGSMIAQSQTHNEEEKEDKDRLMLVGKFSWENWQKEMNWQLDSNYTIDGYKLSEFDDLVVKDNISFLIFAGSWCSDSRSELPKIIDLFQKANLVNDRYELLGVDRMKFEPSGRYMEFNIEKVPTLIVLKEGKEIGRIVEYPKNQWIDDILEIIKQK